MRTAAKVDRNQSEVVAALRKLGASVQSLASIGKGCPDLLVGYHGILYLMEVKDGTNVPSKQLLTEDQKNGTMRGLVRQFMLCVQLSKH